MMEQTTETQVYEPPALVEAGDFAEVTAGPTGFGEQDDWVNWPL